MRFFPAAPAAFAQTPHSVRLILGFEMLFHTACGFHMKKRWVWEHGIATSLDMRRVVAMLGALFSSELFSHHEFQRRFERSIPLLRRCQPQACG